MSPASPTVSPASRTVSPASPAVSPVSRTGSPRLSLQPVLWSSQPLWKGVAAVQGGSLLHSVSPPNLKTGKLSLTLRPLGHCPRTTAHGVLHWGLSSRTQKCCPFAPANGRAIVLPPTPVHPPPVLDTEVLGGFAFAGDRGPHLLPFIA